MVKKCLIKKIFLIDVDYDDEMDSVIWIENKQQKKIYFNCGCCKNCLCNDTSSCKNCGCACNCTEIDDDFIIEDDDEKMEK
jgi:hypothetical protein